MNSDNFTERDKRMLEKSGRIVEIDLLRGAAAIFLLIDHSIITVPIDLSSISWCRELSFFIDSFDMPLFFLIAGYVFHCSSYKEYLHKKAKRLGIPYFVFGGGSILCHSIAGKYLAGGGASISESILNFLFYGGEYWFIYTLFIIYAIYPWIDKLINGTRTKFILFSIIIIVRQLTPAIRFLTISQVLTYLPFFGVGNLMRSMNKAGEKKKAQISIASAALYGTLYTLSHIIGKIYALWVFESIGFCIFLYYLIHIAEKSLSRKLSGKLLNLCGKYSLQLYLINMYLEVAIRIFLCSILGLSSPLLIIGLSVAINLVVTITICSHVAPHLKPVKMILGI